jgi:hypothetical protein
MHVAVGDKSDVSALAAVAPVRTGMALEFITVETHAPFFIAAAFDINTRFIDKCHGSGSVQADPLMRK